MNTTTSHIHIPHDQAAINAVLDAALDQLDDEDDEDDEDDDSGVMLKCDQNDEDNNKDNDVDENIKYATQMIEQSGVVQIDSEMVSQAPAIFYGPEPPPAMKDQQRTTNVTDPEKLIAGMMERIMSLNVPSPNDGVVNAVDESALENMLQQMRTQFEVELQNIAPQADTVKPTKTKSKKANTSELNKNEKVEVKETISNLIEDMSKPTVVDDCTDEFDDSNYPPQTPFELDMLNSLLKGFDDTSRDGKFNSESMVDGMLEHLLSKELMYEPMKQVALKFPKWLSERETVLSPKEYSERVKQSDCFQKLVHVYETDPSNIPKLMEYMQEVQEYGQPPLEIVQEIAPGLELDEDGLPKIDSNLPPFMKGTGNEECCIM